MEVMKVSKEKRFKEFYLTKSKACCIAEHCHVAYELCALKGGDCINNVRACIVEMLISGSWMYWIIVLDYDCSDNGVRVGVITGQIYIRDENHHIHEICSSII